MTNQQRSRAEEFRALHRPGEPLLLPNPWDVGSARLFAALGFAALATTSSGYAASVGRLDGAVTRDEALAHAARIVTATDLPVSADLENCYGDDLDAVADTARLAAEAGLAGFSIEDFTGVADRPFYDLELAAERVAAAVAGAGEGPLRPVVTARAENHIRGGAGLDDTIARLLAYQRAGADVLYAPGLTDLADIARVVDAVDRPVNVLAVAGAPSVAELAEVGVARVSVGGAFASVAYGAAAEAGRELLERGTYGYWDTATAGASTIRAAFAG